ncbi:MAG: diacylglycerol kinase family lipid kinase, partial [Chloroflexota bacterium]
FDVFENWPRCACRRINLLGYITEKAHYNDAGEPMPLTIILNPYSNRWEAGKSAPEIESGFKNAGIEFNLQLTESGGHASELAQQAVLSGNTPIIAVGGDGLISEVVNGMMGVVTDNQLPPVTLGLIPMGTANDLTDVIGISENIDEAIETIAAGHIRTIDLGKVNGHYFGVNAAIGLEPMVTIENIRLTKVKGVVRYLLSAILAIFKNPSWDAHLKWDDQEYKGTIKLVSVGNTNRTGEIFYMTPNAKIDDGYLDFVFAPAMGILRTFQILPKTQKGIHIHEPEVQEHRTKRLEIHTTTPTAIQADGEIIETGTTEIIFEVLPGALNIFSPKS